VPAIPHFIGRDAQLKRIEQHFEQTSESNKRRRVVVIHGLGGIGKTQLAIEYVRRHEQDYSAVLWLNGSSRDRLLQAFLDVAHRIPADQLRADVVATLDDAAVDKETVIEDVKRWLSLPGNCGWLLILDNVDLEYRGLGKDMQGFDPREAIPEADHGSILVTSRLSNMSIGEKIQLGNLGEEDAREVLVQQAGRFLEG